MKILACIAALVLLAGCSDGPEEITEYRANCEQSSLKILPFSHYFAMSQDFDAVWNLKKKSETDCLIVPEGSTRYVLNRERAEVVSEAGISMPTKLVNCAIFDRENWLCEYSDFATGIYKNSRWSGKVGFKNGLPVHFLKESKDESSGGPKQFYLRAWQHWAVTLINITGYRAQSRWLIPEQEDGS